MKNGDRDEADLSQMTGEGNDNEYHWERPTRTTYHAHFDCFSGAAGDMMLAACLDAAGEDQSRLLKHITACIEQGLPELKGEFSISAKKVWRGGMGSIAALHVTVNSRYNHEAAPVPKKGIMVDTHVHSHGHDHSHSHSHSHQRETAPDRNDAETSNQNASPGETCREDQSTSMERVEKINHGHSHNHVNYESNHHSHSHGHGAEDHQDDAEKTTPHANAPVGKATNEEESQSQQYSQGHDHGHSHSHSQSNHKGPLRNLPEIRKMLQSAPDHFIAPWVRETAIASFTELAQAEAMTHGAESIEVVHFHEVGAIDSIIDTVGTLIALYSLGVTSVSCSRLPLGEGTVWTQHGLLPVPAPATLRLLVDMPTCPGPPGVTGELVTPTGAALLRALTIIPRPNNNIDSTEKMGIARHVGPPNFTVRKIGIGAGTKDFQKHPNILRLLLGDSIERKSYINRV
jgi:uncharacterized protein (DUF111 family)